MDVEGKTESIYTDEGWDDKLTPPEKSGIYRPFKDTSVGKLPDGRSCIDAWVQTADQERAVKVANERRAQLIASGELHA